MGLDVSREVKFKCIGCGACEGICTASAVKTAEIGRHGHRPFVDRTLCVDCELCLKICPVKELSVPDDFSRVKMVYRAQSKDPDAYLNGSSGGGVSSILISLFNKNLIDAALVVFYDNKLNLYGDFITSADEVLKHSGSFYQPSKHLINIKKSKNFRAIAVVGLPCHIEAIRKLGDFEIVKNIYVTISLFCTIGRMRAGFIDFIKQKFNKNLDSLEFMSYTSRGGKSRCSKGDVNLRTKSSEGLTYSHTDYIGFVGYFYTPEGCFHCRKIFELNADISIGDDWSINTEKKLCLVSINSERGVEVFSNCDILNYEQMKNPVCALLRSQPRGAPLKVYYCPLKIPVVKMVKAVGQLNRIPVLQRATNMIKAIAISTLIKLTKKTC
jgi:coenzyme F420-reducing hydrogenase beta subunit